MGRNYYSLNYYEVPFWPKTFSPRLGLNCCCGLLRVSCVFDTSIMRLSINPDVVCLRGTFYVENAVDVMMDGVGDYE